MPRDGSGVYSKPANTTATANTTIESSAYNTLTDDIAADLNTARPVVYGGTGATGAAAARINLNVATRPAVEIVSANRTVFASDEGKTLVCTAALTVTLTAADTLGAQFGVSIRANGGDVSINPSGTDSIDGGTSLGVAAGVSVELITDGTSWYVASQSGEPAGRMSEWMTDTVPPGYLAADGSNVSRTQYSRLFAVYGTLYGAGNGSTTFGLPDMRGVFPRGWNHGSGVDPDAVSRTDRGDGTTGDNVGTRQTDEIEAHNHSASTGSAGSHSHTGSANAGGNHTHSAWTGAAGSHSHTASTGSAGLHNHVVDSFVNNLGNNTGNAFYGYPTGDLQIVTVGTENAGVHTHTVTVNAVGDHAHAVGVGADGTHTHSVTVNSGGAHSHSVTVNHTGRNETRPVNVSVMYIIKT